MTEVSMPNRGNFPKWYRFLNRTTTNFSRLTVHWCCKVKRGLNSSKALSVREMALYPKVKDELVKHFIIRRMCIRSNDQWYEAPCISNSWGKFKIMLIMFAEPPLGGSWGGRSSGPTRDHRVPGQIFRIHLKRVKRSKCLSYLPPKGVL
jgi:hypothetical protein